MSKSKGSREVMPEEPQHVLLEGKKDSVFHGETLAREFLEELLEDEAVDCEKALPLGSMKPDYANINCCMRDKRLNIAVPLVPQCAGWESGRQLPIEDVEGKYWDSVCVATQKAISHAILRPARVCMMRDTDFAVMEDCVAFIDIAIGYDVLIIHNEMDILIATCTSETDVAIRKTLQHDGYPAAIAALHLASKTQKKVDIFLIGY
jgi:hypothetical protein